MFKGVSWILAGVVLASITTADLAGASTIAMKAAHTSNANAPATYAGGRGMVRHHRHHHRRR